MRVLIISRDLKKLRLSCENLIDLGAQADYLAGDISDPNLPELAIAHIRKSGVIQIFLSTMAAAHPWEFIDFSDADWQSSIDQNLLSAIRFSPAGRTDYET